MNLLFGLMSEETRENHTRLHDAQTVGWRYASGEFWLDAVDIRGKSVRLHVSHVKAVSTWITVEIVFDLELSDFQEALHRDEFGYGEEGDRILEVTFSTAGLMRLLIGSDSKIEISVVE